MSQKSDEHFQLGGGLLGFGKTASKTLQAEMNDWAHGVRACVRACVCVCACMCVCVIVGKR